MKKILFACMAALLFCLPMKSDDDVWGRARYTNIGYSFAQTGDDINPVDKGQFGVSITKGRTFLFPNKAVADIVKFGFDVNFTDISFAKYKKVTNLDPDFSEGEGSWFSDLGKMSVMLGVAGIGPNVTVAPFARMDNAARYVKASVYFHYQPTFGIYMASLDDDMEAAFAYCNMFQFGGKVTWKNWGLGVEGHWGSGKFKRLEFDEGFGFGGKIKRKFANTRLYLSLDF